MPADASIYLNNLTRFDPFGSAMKGLQQGQQMAENAMRLKDIADQKVIAAEDRTRQIAREDKADAAAERQAKLAAMDRETKEYGRLFGQVKDQASYDAARNEWGRLGYSGLDRMPAQYIPQQHQQMLAATMSYQEQEAKKRQAMLDQREAEKFGLDKQVKQASIGKTKAETAKLQAAANPASKEYKKEQYDAGGFAKRMAQAEGVFGALDKAGYDRTSRLEDLKAKWAPGELQSNQFKQQDQAERNFVNAVLRRESGAAISPSEFASAEQQYFPRPGDPPEVKAQKLANRLQAFEAIKTAAGGAYDQIPTVGATATNQGGFKIPSVGDIDAEIARRGG
jgi:hypothetical protein